MLQNAPKPDPAVVAGAAAAIAGAASLAAPDATARKAESMVPAAELRPIKAGPSVPSDVLDRLDAQARKWGRSVWRGRAGKCGMARDAR